MAETRPQLVRGVTARWLGIDNLGRYVATLSPTESSLNMMRMVGRGMAATIGALGILWPPATLSAQTDVEMLGRRHGFKPPPGYYDVRRKDPRAFQFSQSNGWVVRGRRIAESRRLDRAATAAGAANFQAGRLAADAVTGEIAVVVFLVLYENSDSASVVTNLPRDVFEQRLFGTDAEGPYSVHTFYAELSNDLLGVTGAVFDWTRVSESDSTYEAGCNGLCAAANAPFGDMLEELVQYNDSTVDFGQFDNDGPDGVPNSADDDGFVDAVVLFHPEVDGACGTSNLWAHRWSYRGRRGSDLLTDDDAAGGGKIGIRDYILQGGQGGDNGCTANQPQAIGVVSHETGHLLGLPDLYDTGGGEGEGIGWWGLMGSGNWHVPSSPAHMEAWSKAELGWVTETLIASDSSFDITPVITSDTTYVLPVPSRDEYFILENRQRLGSDAALAGRGLLIWHVDSVLMRQRRPFNAVNASQPNALALEQADGRLDLLLGGNRGDPSDPFPGSRNATQFGTATLPSSAALDGAPSYIVVDSITQQPTGAISVAIRFELPTVIKVNRTQAVFRLDDVERTEFEERLVPGTEHTLEMDEVQVVDGGRRRYTWESWSNGQPRSHSFTASTRGDSIMANVAGEYLVKVTQVGDGGSVSADIAIDLVGGQLLAEGTALTLTAAVDSANHIFEGWTGDTASAELTLALDVHRPFEVAVIFAAPLLIDAASPPEAVMGAFYDQRLDISGGTGEYTWELVSGTIPAGLRLHSDGQLSGVPRAVGSWPFTARAQSGSQTDEQGFTINVVAPALVVGNVVQHLLGLSLLLTPDEIRYLDLLGNQTGQFDLGDFLAWVETTGGVVSAAEMAAVLRSAPPPPPTRLKPDSAIGREP